MLKYRNLMIIGTSHIAEESIKEVERVIELQKPSVVTLELDRGRFYALRHEQESRPSVADIFRIGLVGFIFVLVGSYVQKKLGSVVSAKPGDEMMKAADAASKVNAKIALIDQEIGITLKRLSKQFSFREKMRVFADIFKFIFFRKKAMKEMGLSLKFDLRTVPSEDLIEKLMKKLEKRYPSLFNVLITERNHFMAKRLIVLMKKEQGAVVAVVGAGHSEGLLRDIKSNINKLDIID